MSVPVPDHPRRQCFESKKWKWLTHLMTLNLRCQCEGIISQMSRCLTRRSPQPWTRSSQIPTLERKSVWKSRKLKPKIVFSEGDRLLSWSMSILCLTTRTSSLSLFRTMMFRNSRRGGTKFYYQWTKFPQMMSWRTCVNVEYVSLCW